MRQSPSLVAVDIGNARVKLGCFAAGRRDGVPEPAETFSLLGDEPGLQGIPPWLAKANVETVRWCIASVNRPAATRFIDWLRGHRPGDSIVLLASGDLPLEVRLPRPDMVGIDRLVDAVAANGLRHPEQAAAIVDVGSAITVDLVSADGAFLGGAILPGIHMAGRALHDYTDMLPLVDMAELTVPPPALGTATVPAIQAGLFWGAVGAVRELLAQFRAMIGGKIPQVFLTGGAGAQVAELLGSGARYVPHLTLSGIALAVCEEGVSALRDP